MFTNRPSKSATTLCRIRRSSSPGFTLMEVVIALTILGMITGTLFAILQGSVRGAAQIEQSQRENDGINRFLDLCRKTFTTLPGTATLTLTLLEQGAGQELTISGAPQCFGFGTNPVSYKDTLLGLRPDPAGTTDQNGALVQYLCLSREDLIPQTDANGLSMRQETTGLSAPDEEGRYWMPLLPDVVKLGWRFYQEKDDTWLEEWDDDAWPDLIEVQLTMRDRLTPIRMVYSVPTLLLTAGRGTATSSTATSSTPTPQAGGGGNGGGNNQGGRNQDGRGGNANGNNGGDNQGGGRGGNGGGGNGGNGGGSNNAGGGR